MKSQNRPNQIVWIVSIVLLPAIFTNCTNKLTATFESDTIGSVPDKTLPGNPSGDAISYIPEIETQLEVIASPANPSEKALEYQSVSPSGSTSGHSSWLGFRATSTNFAKPVTFIWTARKNFTIGGPDLYIDCSDGSGVVAARIKILNNGNVILVDDIVSDNGNNIGSLPNNQKHTFMVTVDLPNEVYNISILRESGGAITNNGHTLLTENIALYHNPANPSVSFKYDVFTASQQYVIEEVFINRKN